MNRLKVGKKSRLRVFRVADIRKWNPCYDPTRYLKDGKQYNVRTILDHPEIPDADKLWVALRPEVLDDKTLRPFAVKCARQVLKPDADPRSHKALEVAERFAYGKATREELDAARDAAGAAAWAAADAARDAAGDAARSAAYAARDAAWAAADAARSAARSAAYAAGDAAGAAADAARDAARKHQVRMLREMVGV